MDRNHEEASYAETVRTRLTLGSMGRTENIEGQNVTELSLEVEIGRKMIREELSNTTSPTKKQDD